MALIDFETYCELHNLSPNCSPLINPIDFSHLYIHYLIKSELTALKNNFNKTNMTTHLITGFSFNVSNYCGYFVIKLKDLAKYIFPSNSIKGKDLSIFQTTISSLGFEILNYSNNGFFILQSITNFTMERLDKVLNDICDNIDLDKMTTCSSYSKYTIHPFKGLFLVKIKDIYQTINIKLPKKVFSSLIENHGLFEIFNYPRKNTNYIVLN